MATEIERKFLLRDNSWRKLAHKHKDISQGYLANTDKCSVRVRVAGDKASINIKSMTVDIVRSEYEYPLPVEEAEAILHTLCVQPLICKTRYFVKQQDHLWEIDVFDGDNDGLVIAEIELDSRDEDFSRPDWLGKEVSDDIRYFNISLVKNPYCLWRSE